MVLNLNINPIKDIIDKIIKGILIKNVKTINFIT